MRCRCSIAFVFLACAAHMACSKITADLSGRSCRYNAECIEGWTCDLITSICVEPDFAACAEPTGVSCATPGAVTGCFAECTAVDCAQGCRHCEGVGLAAKWGECTCQAGTTERCSSCDHDCRTQILGAEATCVAAGVDGQSFACSYTGSCFEGNVDVNTILSDGCECALDCAEKCGGDDGCGGICPNICSDIETCGRDNTCVCVPNCNNRCAGDDGCGGTCPDTCAPSAPCDTSSGTCACVPNCGDRCAGDDGCGGSCTGACTGQDACDATLETCVCQPLCVRCFDSTGCGGSCLSTQSCLPTFCPDGHLFPLEVGAGDNIPKGYALQVVLDHAALVVAGADAQGADVSIMYYDGKTFRRIDRVADYDSAHGWNSATTRLWFSAQEPIAASGTDDAYYVLIDVDYGNVLNAVRNVFVFADDFNRPNAQSPGGNWETFSGNDSNAITIIDEQMAFVKTVELENTPGADAPLFRDVLGDIEIIVHMTWNAVPGDNLYAGIIALGEKSKMDLPPKTGVLGTVAAEAAGIGPYFGMGGVKPDIASGPRRRVMRYCKGITPEICVLPAPAQQELPSGEHRLRAIARLTSGVDTGWVEIFQANSDMVWEQGTLADATITKFDRVRILSRLSQESADNYRINDIMVRERVQKEPTVAMQPEMTGLCAVSVQ